MVQQYVSRSVEGGERTDEIVVDVSNLAERTELVLQIIQCCVHPRAKLSLPDAVFTAHFVRKMHSLNTDGFQTIIFYDKVRL